MHFKTIINSLAGARGHITGFTGFPMRRSFRPRLQGPQVYPCLSMGLSVRNTFPDLKLHVRAPCILKQSSIAWPGHGADRRIPRVSHAALVAAQAAGSTGLPLPLHGP